MIFRGYPLDKSVKNKIFPLALFIHPARFFQDAQVLGNGGLGDAEGSLKFTDTALPVHQEPQDAQTIAVSQGLHGFEQGFQTMLLIIILKS